MDRFAKYSAISSALRGQTCELELVTPKYLPDGTVQEVTHLRRATCSRVARKRNSTVLEFVDIDRSVLERPFPFETFTVADFPEIYVDHVGKRIPQGVGLVKKVPTAWVVKTGTQRFAGPRVVGAPGALLAVYRGTQPGQGAVVDPSEYTMGIMATPSGVTVHTIDFTQQQTDFQGPPYVIEADWQLSGTRTAPSEISRILALYGLSVDATFAAASAADAAAGFLIDALYGDPGRAGSAIIGDLLQVARGWVNQVVGAWSIVQDVAKASVAQYDTSADPIEISDYGDGDVTKTVSVYYGSKVSGVDGDYAPPLVRTTATGAAGDREIKLMYVQDATAADRVASYWQKRMNTLRQAKAVIHAAQHTSGDVITVTDNVWWNGAKDVIAVGISRPADANQLVLREYDANVYVYTASTLPAAATNGYVPDYSFTRPAAPTGLVVVSQGTSADGDGKVTAFARVRAVPPGANWSQLWVQLTDTSTNEQYAAQLFLTGGNYEAVVSGMRPNRVHSILAWARNANNVDSNPPATIANFTSATAANAYSGPSGLALSQIQSKEMIVSWVKVADVAGNPKVRRYVVFLSTAGGAFTEIARPDVEKFVFPVVTGTSYQAKVRTEDIYGNETTDSVSGSLTAASKIDDNMIVNQGVNGISIGNGSINRGRSNTTTGSVSQTVTTGTVGSITMDYYTFAPSISSNLGNLNWGFPAAAFADDQGHVSARNTSGASDVLNVNWRNFVV